MAVSTDTSRPLAYLAVARKDLDCIYWKSLLQKSFGSRVKLANVLLSLRHHIPPLSKNKRPTYLWITRLLFWGRTVYCGTIFAFSGLYKHLWQRRKRSRGAEGFISYIYQGGDSRWCRRDQDYGDSFPCFYPALLLPPYVGLSSKIEPVRAADTSMLLFRVKHAYVVHTWMF